MKASKMLIATMKETPTEAQISSHILLLRAGMIRKLVAGVYNYLPLGLRVLNKVENIIREEMDKAGALEILSSAMQPKELWVESGRWQKYGPELMRFKDRKDNEFCLGPTHEEIFTDLVRNEVKSKKRELTDDNVDEKRSQYEAIMAKAEYRSEIDFFRTLKQRCKI